MSDRNARKTRLDRRVDTALGSWPVREMDETAWHAMAKRIEHRLVSAGAAVRGGREDDDSLKAPLPGTPEEMQESASFGRGAAPSTAPPSRTPSATRVSGERSMSSSMPPSERDRDRRSLKDLAKLAASPSLTPGPPSTKGSVAPPPLFGAPNPSDSGDSGIVDFKKITELAPMPPAPVPSSIPGRPVPALAPPPLQSIPASARVSAPPALPREFQPPVSARAVLADEQNPFARKKRGGLVWIVGIGATLAAAAAAVLVLRSQPSRLIAETPPPPAVTAPPSEPTPPAASAAPPAATPPPEAVAQVDTSAPAEQDPSQGGSPGSGPGTASAGGAAGAGPKVLVTAAGSPKKSLSVSGKPSAPASPPNPALVAKMPTSTPPQGGGGSLNDALRQAAGPMDTPAAAGPSTPAPPTDTGSGNVPQKPSLGAVASGVGSAKEQARACLSPDSPISHANITFDSTGSVTSVSVTGFAAGKPAEGCIKAALRRAKLPAFAQPTYTTGVTIRP